MQVVSVALHRPGSRARQCRCTAVKSRTSSLRDVLQAPGIHAGPCCHDALSAKLIEQADFDFAFMSGFCTSAAYAGLPDTGLMSYAEMLHVGRCIHESTSHIPIIGDGDTGYGNAVNVKRTVNGYASAGFAGILIEDQFAPKSCGHVRDKQVVSRDEACARIQAAVDAREEGADILIVARSDARQAAHIDEALERAERFAEIGADILFIDALESAEEMRRFANELRGVASGVPKMASMLEGGGKTPLLTQAELARMNFKLVAYPLSLLGVSVRAMQSALSDLKADRIPDDSVLPSFTDLQRTIGFPQYFQEAERYATAPAPAAPAAAAGSPAAAAEAPTAAPSAAGAAGAAAAAAAVGAAAAAADGASAEAGAGQAPGDEEASRGIEADAIIEPDEPSSSQNGRGVGGSESSDEVTTAVLVTSSDSDEEGSGRRGSGIDFSNVSLRIRVEDMATGEVKLETRFPAKWMASIATFVPQLAGADLEDVIRQIRGGSWTPSEPAYEFRNGSEVTSVYIEEGAV
eukprot:jgi/Ulvmu1/1097/UM106_0013.1